VRLPPHPAAQEAPLEELAAGDRQAVEPAAAQHDRDDARPLLPRPHDADAVAQRAPDREADARREDDGERPQPQRRPPGARDRVPDERRARVDLVREREEQREVGVEVHGPPRLVGHPPAREPVGGDAGREQEQRADGRGEDARIGPQELPELVQDARARLPRVADGDQHRMAEQQIERPGPELAMPGHEPVLADRPFERRHPRDEQDDDHHRVGGEQARQTAEGDGDAARRAERAGALGGHLEPDRDAEPDPGRGGQDVDDDRSPPRRTAAWGDVGGARADPRRRVAPEALGGVESGHDGEVRERRSEFAPRWLRAS